MIILFKRDLNYLSTGHNGMKNLLESFWSIKQCIIFLNSFDNNFSSYLFDIFDNYFQNDFE